MREEIRFAGNAADLRPRKDFGISLDIVQNYRVSPEFLIRPYGPPISRGAIAPGNRLLEDSLRSATPPGEGMAAAPQSYRYEI